MRCPGGQPHTQRKMSDTIVSRFQLLVASSVSYFRRTMWLLWIGRIFLVGEGRGWGCWGFRGFCLLWSYLEIQRLFWEPGRKRDLWSGDTTWHGAHRHPWCVVAVSCISEVNNTTTHLKGISICFHITWFHSFTVNMRLC